MNPENNNQMSESAATTPVSNSPHPVNQITPLSKYLALTLFVLLPFVGGYIGYRYATPEATVAPLDLGVSTQSESSVSTTPLDVKNSEAVVYSDLVLYATQESEIPGNGRGYPVLGLYKMEREKEPVKFSSVGAYNEYPVEFAVSPNRKKVAVNLETKLVVIDVETGVKETIFTPEFVVGGRIAFSSDGTQLAFIDGNYFVSSEYSTLYTFDLANKKLIPQLSSAEMKFIDVDAWRSDNVIVLSATAGKGCALPEYSLYDLTTKKLSSETVPDFRLRSGDGTYVVIPTKTDTPDACLNVGSMCDYAYKATMHYRVYDPLTNVILGEFGQDKARVEFITLSPDDGSVLYKVIPWPTTEAQCDDTASGLEYYVKNFSSNTVEIVKDLESKLTEWGIAVEGYSPVGGIITPSYKTN